MVPEPVTSQDQAGPVLLHRVGPGHPMAADTAYGVALLTLWHAVTDAGGPVGFVRGTSRAELAPAAAAAVEDLRQGRAQAIAATSTRSLVGVGFLYPGTGTTAHTGRIDWLMVDPQRQRQGLGGRILDGLVDIATERGLELLELTARSGYELEAFYGRHGFVEFGRRRGWIRQAAGDDRDEILLARRL